MNTILLLLEIVLCFGFVLFLNRWAGKSGLIVWVAVATVLANIMTAKTVSICGLDVTLGTVLFASTFLCTDIITELYGAREAKKAVLLGLSSAASFIVASQICLAYTPSAIDYADGSMRELFALNLRISCASILMYFIANYCDVLIYDRLKKNMGDRRIWFRNNVATILCNGLENFGFIGLAFAGLYGVKDILIIAGTTTLLEIVVAICDTPFLYIAIKEKRRTDGKGENEYTRAGTEDSGAGSRAGCLE
ncbi:MAG: queuosine precursor transporter [Clostridiales bacterium]|nr:queuosine precursor transporter [Clostridiales bacterium]